MKENVSRSTWAEIDLSVIQRNIQQLKGKTAGKVKTLAVVKANAYGHGMMPVVNSISNLADYLGVATVDEGIFLRDNGVKLPILIMSAVLPQEAEQIVKYGLTATVFSFDIAKVLDSEAERKNKKVKIHLKIDTGMGRIGIWYKDAEGFISEVHKLKNLEIEGIYTHFSNAEEDNNFTCRQIERFNKVLSFLKCKNIKIPFKHAANSASTVRFNQTHFNLIRPGIMIYGIYPHKNLKNEIKLEPALSLKSRLTYIKGIEKGRSVSYGRTFIAKEYKTIGTVPIGYGDGYSFLLSNKGKALVHGEIVPIVGRVCMDQLMLDLSKINNPNIGDEVVFIGEQEDKQIKVEEVAELIGSIPYEILCMISSRVPRVFK